MKTDIHFWSHLAQFILEWEMFQTKVVQKIKTHILCYNNNFFSPRKSCRLWDNVGKFCTAGAGHRWQYGALRIACRILKATNTHSQYVILIAFPPQQWLREHVSMFHVHCQYCFDSHFDSRTVSTVSLHCYSSQLSVQPSVVTGRCVRVCP